jgi:Tol biopolymer transport system component
VSNARGSRSLWFLLSLVTVVGCGDDIRLEPLPDGSVPSEAIDAGAGADALTDAPVADAAVFDAAQDASEVDASPDAAETVADASVDASPDAPPPDAPPPDALPPDAAPPDAPPLPPLGGTLFAIANDGRNGGDAWIVSVPLDGGPATNLSSTSGYRISNLEVAPDGTYVAFIGAEQRPPSLQRLFVVPTDGSQSPRDLSGPLPEGAYLSYELALSPDGARIAYEVFDGASQIFTVRPDGSDRVPVSPRGSVGEWGWRAGHGDLYYASNDERSRQSVVLTCADRDCSRSLTAGLSVGMFAFSPDGRHLAVIGGSALSMVDVATAASRRISSETANFWRSLVWSPDSARVTYGRGTTDVYELRVACAVGTCDAAIPLPFTVGIFGDDLQWSPDSAYLMAVTQERNGAPLHVFTACGDGTCVHEHPTAPDPFQRSVAWSPDGRLVHRALLGSTTSELVADCRDRSCPRVAVSGGKLSYAPPRWSRDGQAYVFSTQDSLWAADTIGAPVRAIGPAGNLELFDATGKRVLYWSGSDGLRLARIDGSENRRLDAQLSHGGRLSGYRLIVR